MLGHRRSGLALAAALAAAVALAVGSPGCSDDTGPNEPKSGTGGGPPLSEPHDWTECQASTQAFVRRAILGRGQRLRGRDRGRRSGRSGR
jgi:hypothetical protein